MNSSSFHDKVNKGESNGNGNGNGTSTSNSNGYPNGRGLLDPNETIGCPTASSSPSSSPLETASARKSFTPVETAIVSQEDAATTATSYTEYSFLSQSSGPSIRGGAQDDVWESLRGRLLGREEHQQALRDCYQRILSPLALDPPLSSDDASVVYRSEIVLITGAAGTGKSALAKALLPTCQRDNNCIFLTGKCEQKTLRPEPFAPFVSAFTRYLHQTQKNEASFSVVKDRVVAAVEQASQDSDPGVLFNMIPPLRSFFGEQQIEVMGSPIDIPSLFHAEATASSESTRGARTSPHVEAPTISLFCSFLKAFCSYEHPMVLLIDDWQWLDSASLKLIEKIALQSDLNGLFLMGTCRGNEVHSQAPLSAMLRSLENRGVRITDIAVGPLEVETVMSLVSELLHNDLTPMTEALAKFVHERTEGNPFLVLELFRTLVDRRLLQQIDGTWTWDEAALWSADESLGSIQMLDETVQHMASSCSVLREFIKIASCLGSEFEIAHVQRVAGLSHTEARGALLTLHKRGILASTADRSRHRCAFAHDRWCDVAHSLIPAAAKDAYLLWVGSQLLVHLSVDELLDNIFLVAQLLYPKASSIEDEADRNHVAEVFGLAGTKAAQCSAFEVSGPYFSKAISLLPANRWEPSTYSLCLQLYNFSAEIECCLGHMDKSDQLVDEILANTNEIQDQLRAYETKIHSLSARNDFQASVELGFHILALLGEPMPKHRGGLNDLWDLAALFRIVRTVQEEKVMKLRRLKNWKKLEALKIIQHMGASVIQSKPEFMLHMTIKAIKLTLNHGLSPLACVHFSTMGMILCYPLGMMDEGLRFEQLGHRIYQEFASKDLMCRVHLVRYSHVLPWRQPVRICIPKILDGARAGMLSGDIEMAGMNYAHAMVDKLLSGFPIQEVFEETTHLAQQFSTLNQESIVFYFKSSIQVMRNLKGLSDNPLSLKGDDFDAMESIRDMSTKNYAACLCWLLIAQQFLALWLGDFASAADWARELATQDKTAFCGFLIQYMEFLWAMSEAVQARQPEGTRKNRRLALKALNRLKKITDYPRPERGWSNKILMVEAELSAYKDHKEEALVKWLASIRDAERQGLVHEEALAHERMAHTLMEWGQDAQALDHYREARSLYQSWGCVVKTEQMRRIVGERSLSVQQADRKIRPSGDGAGRSLKSWRPTSTIVPARVHSA